MRARSYNFSTAGNGEHGYIAAGVVALNNRTWLYGKCFIIYNIYFALQGVGVLFKQSHIGVDTALQNNVGSGTRRFNRRINYYHFAAIHLYFTTAGCQKCH